MLDTQRLCLGCMNDNGGEKICSICGYDSNQKNAEGFLPERSWIKDRYLVGTVIESNGEGVTYIGWDNKEDSIVNIREYFPKNAAVRNNDHTVSISQGDEFAFNNGIMSFLELNRKLIKLADLPAIMPIVEVFEGNGTAYSIIKVAPSITLREFLVRNGGNLNWEQARSLFAPLITTLIALNNEGIIHRGISPETVMVGRDGKLRLSGICIRAVRMSKGDLQAHLYPGFSAVEQYGYDVDCLDGKYTDVYGVAATLFRVLMGKAPTDVSERIVNDNMEIPTRYAETMPKYVLSALANALQIMPENRTRDLEAFRLSLTPVGAEVAPTPQPVAPVVQEKKAVVQTTPTAPKISQTEQKKNSRKTAVIAAVITSVVFIVIALLVYFLFLKPTETPSGSSNPSSSQPPVSIPSESAITSADDGKLYQVPDFVGQKYADVMENTEYTNLFKFTVANKEFSDNVPRGYVISQNPTKEQAVKKESTIELVLSLGPKEVGVPNLVGKTYEEAVLELLKQGFIEENIKMIKVYDSTQPYKVVIETEPSANVKVDTASRIVLRVNQYDPNDTSSDTPE